MARQPSYEELKERVDQLEAEQGRHATLAAALKRSLRFTESLLAAMPVAVFYKDAQGRYQGCNPAFSEVMGVTPEQIRGKTVEELWPSEHAAVYHLRDLELIRQPTRQVYEFEVRDKDGAIRPVIFYKNVFYDEHGDVAGLVGGFVDLSERRQAEKEQQTIFAMSLDMLCIADIQTASFVKVNPAFTATLGYSEAELLGKPFAAFLHPDDIEPTRRVVEEYLQRGEKLINFKNRYRCKNGAYRWLNWVSHPVPENGLTYAVAHDISDEMQAREEREASHHLLQSVLNAVPDLLIVVDREFNILYSNYKGHDQIDPPPGNLGGTCYGRFKRLAAPCADCSAAPVFATGRIVSREMVNPADGRLREVRAFPIRDAAGNVTHVVEYVRDISEVRQAQEEIRRRRQFLESLLYHAPDAIVTLDERHRVMDWNPGAVKMFGYSPQEAIGMPLDDLVAPHEHRAEAGDKTRQVLSGQRVEAFETVRFGKDGKPLNVIAAGSPIMVDGVLKGVVAVYTDITDRVRAEAALRVSHQRFLTVLDSIPATIYVADMESHEILFMNRFMIEGFGRDMTGEICWQSFRGEAGPCSNCTNERLVDENGRPTGVCEWEGKNPVTDRWYMNYDRAIEWTDGRLVRLQIAIDTTDSKKMEEGLRRAQKMEAVGTLAGGIAHDFNNLLMGIQGRASLIGVDLDPSHPHAEHVHAIENYIRSAMGLTKQLLGFVRGGKYEVKPVDINALVESSAKMFGRTRKEVQIRLKTAPDALVSEADRQQLDQVLLNLYVNAWQAMPGGGDLFLETRAVRLDEAACQPHQVRPGRYVHISVTDTGIGMDEAIRQRIFDPFFTTKQKGRGTGLGLASAYGIVRNHGGMITVYSEAGRGTTVNIYLPLSEQAAEPEVRPESDLLMGSETILLVDDEEMIVEVGQAMLERLGYGVVVARGGAAAIATVSEMGGAIDLVILDLIMPGIDGGKTFDRIRALAPAMPVILSSGYSINGQATNIMQRGCNAFIQKPFNIAELSQKIRQTLDAANRSGNPP